MMHEVQLIEGIFQPKAHFLKLKEAEGSKGLWWRIVLLTAASGCLFFFMTVLGLGMEDLMANHPSVPLKKLEMMKMLFAAGYVVQGICAPLAFIAFSSLLYKAVFREIPFYQLMTIQFYTAVIFFVEKVLFFPFRYFLGFNEVSSPFSLGMMAQLWTDQPFVIHLMNGLSIFFIWGIIYQIFSLIILSSRPRKMVVPVVIFVNVFILLIAALLTTINIDTLLS
jgi:hypothetical protein